MKIRYPRASVAILAAALLAGTSVVTAYAVTESAAPSADTAAAENGSTWWKAEISDYDSSLSLVQYEEIKPSQAQIDAMEQATTPAKQAGKVAGSGETLGSSSVTGSANVGAAASMAPSVEAGQFAFTTYGYGHCVGMSQNGADYYATYGGYDYQSILFHYYPGTSLVQTGAGSITANGVTGSALDILSQIVYAEMSSTMHPEAMKAQAVAAYTYIMFNGGSVTGVCLKANPPQNVVDAVSSVVGQALYYDGDYALTVYGASSGGATASAADIWGRSYDYLVSVPSEYDALYDPNYGEVTYMSTDEVRSRIQGAYGIALSDNPANWIQMEIGDSGFVRSVNIDGQKTVNGYSFSGVMGLKTPLFAYICG